MKKYFITGLVTLLPLAITFLIVGFIVNILTQPFVGILTKFLEKNSFYVQYATILRFGMQILLLFGIFFFIVLLGFLAKMVIFKSLLSIYDKILHKIPIIKSVYKAAQQVMKTVFETQSQSFKQVVMVPFPSKDVFCIGLVSNDAPEMCQNKISSELVTVFIPTTPNPTSGFLTMYKQEDIIYIDMKIEEAFKYVISCGILHDTSKLNTETENVNLSKN